MNARKEIIKRIESQSRFIKGPEITELSTLYDEFTLVKGTFCSYPNENDRTGYAYPFFGVLLLDEDKLLIEEFCELLQVAVVYEDCYFVTLWQKAEACSRSLIIYKLENKSLREVFNSTELLTKEYKRYVNYTEYRFFCNDCKKDLEHHKGDYCSFCGSKNIEMAETIDCRMELN